MVDVKARIAAFEANKKGNQSASDSLRVQPPTVQGIRNGQSGVANRANRGQSALAEETVGVLPVAVNKTNIIQPSLAQKTVILQPVLVNEEDKKQSASDKGTGKVLTARHKEASKPTTETTTQLASEKGTSKPITETNTLHAPPKETSKPTTEPNIMQSAPAKKAGKPTAGTNITKHAHKGAVNNRFRTRFKEGERLEESEGITIEYKNYRWPFLEEMNVILKATINSFLNNQGGRIYIGVTDEGIVRGIKLSQKEEDNFIQHISWLVKFFDPPIQNNDLIRIRFIGITNQKGKVIPGRFVVKIIVKQGDPSELYSVSDEFFKAYFRKDRQTFPALKPREIKEQIKKRQISPGLRIQASEFDDPEPEQIEHLNIVERGDLRQSPMKQIKENRSEDEEEEKKNEDDNKEKFDQENYSYAIEEVKRDGYRTKDFFRSKDNNRSRSHFRDKSRDKNGY